MKLLFLSGVALGDGVDAFPEDVKDVAEPLASSLIRRGKAVPFEAKKKAKKGDPKGSSQEGSSDESSEGSDGGDA